MADLAYKLARDLLRIDNRSNADLASACSLTSETVRRIRDGEGAFIRSTTISAICKAARRELFVRAAR